MALAAVTATTAAEEWTLRLGDTRLEGISVDESVAGDRYHLGLTSESAWFTFAFPADGGARPSSAYAERINLNGFDPAIRCTEPGPEGVLLEGRTLFGSVVCPEPGGTLMLEAEFGD
jgi:hypothetical protein